MIFFFPLVHDKECDFLVDIKIICTSSFNRHGSFSRMELSYSFWVQKNVDNGKANCFAIILLLVLNLLAQKELSLCFQLPQSWQSVGTFSSVRLIYWMPWWTTSFRQLCGLPLVYRWWVNLKDDYGNVIIRSLQDVAKPMVLKMFGWLVLYWISLRNLKSDQYSPLMILRLQNTKPKIRWWGERPCLGAV